MREASLLYLSRLHKLFYFVNGKNIDWNNPRTITLNSPAGIICLFTEITLAVVLSIYYTSIHFWYILNFDYGKHKHKCCLLLTKLVVTTPKLVTNLFCSEGSMEKQNKKNNGKC